MKTLSIILLCIYFLLAGFCIGINYGTWEAKENLKKPCYNTQLYDTQTHAKIKAQRIKDREKLSKLGVI